MPPMSLLFAPHRGEQSSSSSSFRRGRRIIMRRHHPQHPVVASSASASSSVHPFIGIVFSKLQFRILFIGLIMLLLFWITRISMIFEYKDSSDRDRQQQQQRQRHDYLRGAGRSRSPLILVHSDSQPFNDNSIATKATHLIIVAGHSVLISADLENAAREDSVWYMYDYQRNRGLPQAIVSHIQAGIQLALQDEHSLLVFSGGQTRSQTGPEAEGGSYFRVADALELWDGRDVFSLDGNDGNGDADTAATEQNVNETVDEEENSPRGISQQQQQQQQQKHLHQSTTSTVRARTIAEEYATDSFENLLFSICRFHEVTGSYPQQISLVSFSFKRQRFETLHAAALLWPLDHFHYVGIDPPSYTGFDLQLSSEGERTNSLVPFQSDPYGCHSDILQNKRKERNPFSRRAPYELTCPDMKDLLHWCGPEIISKDKVPWGG